LEWLDAAGSASQREFMRRDHRPKIEFRCCVVYLNRFENVFLIAGKILIPSLTKGV